MAWAIALLLGLVIPTQARAGEFSPQGREILVEHEEQPVSPSDLVLDEEDFDDSRGLVVQAVRQLQTITSVMLVSPYRYRKKPPRARATRITKRYPPAADTLPLVVKPPEQIKEASVPPPNNPPGGEHTPEPGSLTTALIGSALATVAWFRRRRQCGSEQMRKLEVV